MTTFDTDFLRLEIEGRKYDVPLKNTPFSWPPEEKIVVPGFGGKHHVMKLVRRSQLTDEQCLELNGRIVRGAEYVEDV